MTHLVFSRELTKKFPSGSLGSLYAHPLPGAPLSTKCGRQSIEGYARDGDLSVDRCARHEPDGNRTHTSYHSVLACTIVVLGGACKSCVIIPTALVVWSPSCTRGNKTHDVSAGSLIVKMTGSGLGEAYRKEHGDPLACGEGLRLSIELPDQELAPCKGFLARGSNEDLGEACTLLDTSVKIPESSMGVCISISSLASAFILLPWLCALLFEFSW
jgi:hypothetical protein